MATILRHEVGYVSATRHPWPCLLFLLPLLGAYEAGVIWLGGKQGESLRNGADTWVHMGLQAVGLSEPYWPPLGIALLFLGASILRNADRPKDVIGVWIGMAVESVALGFGLWGISRGLHPFLKNMGVVLNAPPQPSPDLGKIITFVGAGIYEEVLFRLLLFGLIVYVMRRARRPALISLLVAAVVSALIFAAAHHAGRYGEPYQHYTFLFRTVAGIYFALVYYFRGFGIAVGAHACYNVLVGVGLV